VRANILVFVLKIAHDWKSKAVAMWRYSHIGQATASGGCTMTLNRNSTETLIEESSNIAEGGIK